MTAGPVEWFIPPAVRISRTDWELARTFVIAHIAGPAIAQPLWIYLYVILPDPGLELAVLAAAIASFWLLPLVLRATGDLWVSALISYQTLAAASLWGYYHYGGASSPFLPWLVVSLVMGLSYLSKRTAVVLSLFVIDISVFVSMVGYQPPPPAVPPEALATLGWLSIGSAMIYMAWMASHYSSVVSLRAELEEEDERSRAASVELETARAVAESMGQARSRFFTKMSHELRTPLNAIIGYSEILAEDLEETGAQDQQRIEDVHRINAAGKHLLSLVSSVLDADAIARDGTRVELAPVRLGELCDEVVASALPMIEHNANHFVVACPDRDRQVVTDPTKLRQIAINLLSNAGKFTERGVVKLEVLVEDRPGGATLRLVVSDTGIGIAAEAMPRLFTDYEQADVSVGSRFGGTGIGLALSRRFCVLLGGGLTVTSRPGFGSRFVVAVPTDPADDRGAQAPPDDRRAAA